MHPTSTAAVSFIPPWAVVLKNPNTKQQATDTRVTALFYDSTGILLKTDSETATVIFPGQTTAVGSTYFSPGGTPAKMEIRVEGTQYQTGASTLSLEVSDPQLILDRYFPTVRAKVFNPFTMDLKDLSLLCIVSDANGKYLAVGSSFLDLLPTGATGIGECDFDSRENTAGAANTRLFVGVSFLTLSQITPTSR